MKRPIPSVIFLLGLFTLSSQAEPILDCPMASMPFSVDSPLSDVLANPQALKIVSEAAPQAIGMLTKAPSEGGLPPGFTNILSPRLAFSFGGAAMSEQKLDAVDAKLKNIPVSLIDQQQRCSRYDNERPELPKDLAKPAVLVFQKITGFRDDPSVNAAQQSLKNMAKKFGWHMVFVDKAGVFNADDLAKFDTVIWNNVSGDALTLTQRQAFKDYMQNGGGYVGIHGSNGDPVAFWDWYTDELVGARFTGHAADPQYQQARVVVENPNSGLTTGFPAEFNLLEEWYSFDKSPRDKGYSIWLSLDESSYSTIGFGGHDISMQDHPVVWSHCVGKGRSFYTAIGHRPEVYVHQYNQSLLENGIQWSMDKSASCHSLN